LRKTLKAQITQSSKDIKSLAQPIVKQINDNGLQAADFFYKAGRVYKFITTTSQGLFSIDPTVGYVATMETVQLAHKDTSSANASTIESLRPQLVELAQQYTNRYGS